MKVTVHVGFEQADLARLDAWAKSHRLTRGAAIMSLLDLVLGRATLPTLEEEQDSLAKSLAKERHVDLDY